MNLDLPTYYKKLVNHEPISEDEIVALLKEVAHFRDISAYLASCHAATAEALPKSASKSARGRMVTICDMAAKALRGDASGIGYRPVNIENEIKRCERVVEEQRFNKPAA